MFQMKKKLSKSVPNKEEIFQEHFKQRRELQQRSNGEGTLQELPKRKRDTPRTFQMETEDSTKNNPNGEEALQARSKQRRDAPRAFQTAKEHLKSGEGMFQSVSNGRETFKEHSN